MPHVEKPASTNIRCSFTCFASFDSFSVFIAYAYVLHLWFTTPPAPTGAAS